MSVVPGRALASPGGRGPGAPGLWDPGGGQVGPGRAAHLILEGAGGNGVAAGQPGSEPESSQPGGLRSGSPRGGAGHGWASRPPGPRAGSVPGAGFLGPNAADWGRAARSAQRPQLGGVLRGCVQAPVQVQGWGTFL